MLLNDSADYYSSASKLKTETVNPFIKKIEWLDAKSESYKEELISELERTLETLKAS